MISVTPAAVISRATDMTYAAMISTAMTHGLIWLYLMEARSATNYNKKDVLVFKVNPAFMLKCMCLKKSLEFTLSINFEPFRR